MKAHAAHVRKPRRAISLDSATRIPRPLPTRDAGCGAPASRILHAPTTVHYCTVIASIVTDADAAESLHPAGCTYLGTAVLYIYNKSIANKGAGCGEPEPASRTLDFMYIYDSAIRGAISDCTVHTLSPAPLMTRLSQG